MNLIKRLTCKHTNQTCISNIHGDWINFCNCRSVWVCKDCGKVFHKWDLYKDCKVVNFNAFENMMRNYK